MSDYYPLNPPVIIRLSRPGNPPFPCDDSSKTLSMPKIQNPFLKAFHIIKRCSQKGANGQNINTKEDAGEEENDQETIGIEKNKSGGNEVEEGQESKSQAIDEGTEIEEQATNYDILSAKLHEVGIPEAEEFAAVLVEESYDTWDKLAKLPELELKIFQDRVGMHEQTRDELYKHMRAHRRHVYNNKIDRSSKLGNSTTDSDSQNVTSPESKKVSRFSLRRAFSLRREKKKKSEESSIKEDVAKAKQRIDEIGKQAIESEDENT